MDGQLLALPASPEVVGDHQRGFGGGLGITGGDKAVACFRKLFVALPRLDVLRLAQLQEEIDALVGLRGQLERLGEVTLCLDDRIQRRCANARISKGVTRPRREAVQIPAGSARQLERVA